jgi:hypothetical protein
MISIELETIIRKHQKVNIALKPIHLLQFLINRIMIKCLTSTSKESYSIDVRLGIGASGSVFRCLRMRDNKQVAIKQIPKYLTDERQISEFLVA